MSIRAEEVIVRGPQDLEDLATAGWLSQSLFAAFELDLFEAIGPDDVPLDVLAERCSADPAALRRLVEVLVGLGILSLHGDRVACATVARRYLLTGADGYLGNSLRYRQRLAANWTRLADAVRRGGSPLEAANDDDPAAYRARVRAYVLAMDDVAYHKARLLADRIRLDRLPLRMADRPPFILDLGGGAGAMAAGLVRRFPGWRATVVDIPEVVEEALGIWADRGSDDLTGGPLPLLRFTPRDLLTEPLPAPPDGGTGWDLVVLSNIVHAFGEAESSALLAAAAAALSDDGLLVAHDFWTDGPGRGPAKSALFDLHMLVNTYQGRTYPWAWARERLAAAGLSVLAPVHLGERHGAEDTSLVVAARSPGALSAVAAGPLDRLRAHALDLGFAAAVPLEPSAVVTAGWVREKCRFGCGGYGAGAQCPPRSPSPEDTRALLSGYGRALLVRGQPPTAAFHRLMLDLERAAFLAGFPRALVFVAGPCRLCSECEPDACRRPKEARPSMEAAGIDVYATAANAGWRLEPVPDRESPVTYLGLLLVD